MRIPWPKQPVSTREEVQSLAKSDPERALAVARTVAKPWYRCQALAIAARFAPDSLADTAFKEAVAAAGEGDDAYQRTAVLAWPIRAAIESRRPTVAKQMLLGALRQVPSVDPLASRASALSLLWQAAYPGGRILRDMIWETVVETCRPDTHWRVQSLYREIAAMLRSGSGRDADKVIEALPPGKTRTKLENAKARSEIQEPRLFFW